MAFATGLTKVGHRRDHFNERTGMCYHQAPPVERVVAHVGDAGQAKSHLEHNPLSLPSAWNATPIRKLNDPAFGAVEWTNQRTGALESSIGYEIDTMNMAAPWVRLSYAAMSSRQGLSYDVTLEKTQR